MSCRDHLWWLFGESPATKAARHAALSERASVLADIVRAQARSLSPMLSLGAPISVRPDDWRGEDVPNSVLRSVAPGGSLVAGHVLVSSEPPLVRVTAELQLRSADNRHIYMLLVMSDDGDSVAVLGRPDTHSTVIAGEVNLGGVDVNAVRVAVVELPRQSATADGH